MYFFKKCKVSDLIFCFFLRDGRFPLLSLSICLGVIQKKEKAIRSLLLPTIFTLLITILLFDAHSKTKETFEVI